MLSLLLFASAAAAPLEEKPRVAAAEPVRATVRILRGAEIRLESPMTFEEGIRRETMVREPDGLVRSATLIEYH